MHNHVTNRQLFFIVFFTLVSYTVVELPKIMAESVGTGAWITIIIASIFFIFPVWTITYLGNTFKEKTLFEYSQLLVGKFITYIFVGIYFIYFFIVLAMINRGIAEIVKTDLLPKTPIWAISLLIIVVSAYAASKGITNLGRMLEYNGVMIIIFLTAIHTIMFANGDIMNIRPLYNVDDIGKYIKGSFEVITAFLGFEILTVIPLSKENGKKAIYYSIAAVIAVGLVYIFIIESSFSIVGVEDIVNYRDALVVAIRRVNAEYLQFFKRIDILFIFSWLMAVFSTISMLVYTANEYISKVIPKINKGITLWILTILALIVSIIPSNFEVSSKVFLYATQYFGLIPAFLIPLILLIIAKVKKYDAKNN